MATLPRMHGSKDGANASLPFPFSTSPRKLQEMSLPSPDCHDLTAASGLSMKQYEDQMNAFKKENFHLKLRIYFLEEKLGHGAPPSVQGLLEHNVRLQVELQELRRQITDKQELLAAAAEAIDVLEQQGSMSTDSVEASMTNSIAHHRDNCLTESDMPDVAWDKFAKNVQTCGETTCLESESALETIPHGDAEVSDDLMRLRRENRKALQMIKGCMKKIHQQDKEIKKLKVDKELAHGPISGLQVDKYEEVVKCKDNHIKDLENKIKELQKSADNASNANSGNLQELLMRRLQGLAYFLDKLLSHKCVLDEEKKKLAESILEQSLAFPVGLKLDESMAPEDFNIDEINMDISQSLRLEDLTIMFGHHMYCSDENRHSSRKPMRHLPQADLMSESECWSEPDRNVSLARIGLGEVVPGAKEATSEVNRHRARRSRVSYGSRSEDNKITTEAVFEEVSQLMSQIELLEREKNDMNSKLQYAKEQIDGLMTERNNLKESLAIERENAVEANKSATIARQSVIVLETRVKEIEQQLSTAVKSAELLRAEKQELEATFVASEQMLRRAADEAAVQASQAALERARAQHECLRIERELEDTREKLTAALDANIQLQIEATQKIALETRNKMPELNEAAQSEEDRPTSPDQGIDSDRLSSLEQNEVLSLSPRSLYEENLTLKQKLARTKMTLAETLTRLNAANMRKKTVQRAICMEIHKTQGVLRKAREGFEKQNQEFPP